MFSLLRAGLPTMSRVADESWLCGRPAGLPVLPMCLALTRVRQGCWAAAAARLLAESRFKPHEAVLFTCPLTLSFFSLYLFPHVASAEELAKKQLELMQAIDSYTLAEHTRVMKWTAESSGIKPTGIQALLRTSEQQKELEEAVLTDVKIGEAVTPAESANPASIQRKEKLRIAAAAGTDVSRVNKFLDGFEQSKSVHAWIQSRKKRGLPVPESMGELFPAMLADKTGLAANKSAGAHKPRNLRAAVRSTP